MATVVLAYTEEEAMDKLTRIPQYRELPPTAKVRAIDITSTYFSQGYDIQIHQSKGVYH